MSYIETDSELDKILAENTSGDFLLFKHSGRCVVSAMVKTKFDRWVTKNLENVRAYTIDVIKDRSMSEQIKVKFQIRHESPQLIWLRNGKVIWHGSHFDITDKNLNICL